MLVNPPENHAHQGLIRFSYRDNLVRDLRFQFVQQTSPYLLQQHFIAWGSAAVEVAPLAAAVAEAAREKARRALSARLPSRPWSHLGEAADSLRRFGEPLDPKWRVANALVLDTTLYYQESQTPTGPFPYPLEMRFGVRSIMKSISAPLALLRLAQLYGPDVLNERLGAYVPGLDPKYDTVRFIDAANMASGFGGTGTLCTQPNNFEDGYLDADYDGWYTAPSHSEKVAHMAKWLGPYPWEPGTVLRYRDHDFYLLGAAINGYVKSIRGAQADIWDLLCEEVFAPIGIYAAPTLRTCEPGAERGLVWFNAGYFPTLDDLAKITLLYQSAGEWGGQQLLHQKLTVDLLAARHAMPKNGDATRVFTPPPRPTHYGMGFHYTPYRSRHSCKVYLLPTMWGSGESEVLLFPTGLVSIRIGKAAGAPGEVLPYNQASYATIEAVEGLRPFS
jgi:CubicO group peptidase (beta-lactamase class C family)